MYVYMCVCIYITCEVHDPRKYIANVEILLKSHHTQFVLKITSQYSMFSYLDKIASENRKLTKLI